MSVEYEWSRRIRRSGGDSSRNEPPIGRCDGFGLSSEQGSGIGRRQGDVPVADPFRQDLSCEPSSSEGKPTSPVLGAHAQKLFQIFVASSSHTTILAVLLLWIEVSFQTFSVGRESVSDTVVAFAVVWLATFGCFYLLFEDDEL